MKITGEELKNKIKSGETFIVDIYAEWCGPCKMMSPIIENLSNELKKEDSSVGVYKLDIEENKNLAVDLGVRSIPNIKVYKDGENVINKVGLLNEQQLRGLVKEVV